MIKYLTILICVSMMACNKPKSAEGPEVPPAPSAPPPPVEIADTKYADIGKAGLAALSSGDIDKWMEQYADNATYRWNNGDSLIGKPAISAYWKKRRTEAIETIKFENQIWLPVKVNTPAIPQQFPGNWVLGWYMTTAKYKTGKSMTQWIHTDMHFDGSDKIDAVIQYLDRAPINEAMKK